MALSRPTRFYPDKASGEYKAINASKTITSAEVPIDVTVFKMDTSSYYISTPFTFVVNGTSLIKAIQINIYDMSNGITWTSLKVNATGNLYPTNYKGEENIIKAYIPSTVPLGTTVNSNYVWAVTVFWDENSVEKSITGVESYFESRPDIQITDLKIDNVSSGLLASYTITGAEHLFEVVYTPSSSIVPIKYFNWTLRESNGVLVYTTGDIYSSDIRFNYDNFLPNFPRDTIPSVTGYELELYITNIVGNEIRKTFILNNGQTTSFHTNILSVSNIPEQSCLYIKWGTIVGATGYRLYKHKKNDSYMQYLYTFPSNINECYDYSVANGVEYTYYLFPFDATGIMYPVVYRNTSNVTLYCRAGFLGNVLMILNKDTTQKDNIYKLFKLYSWYLNLDTTNYKVTSNISINNNYTKYPRVQKSRQNYMAISLQSLMGYMSCTNIEVIDTQELIDDIRNLINTNLVMLLKTTKGAILKVTPSSDISFNINEVISLTSLSLDLVEIGDAKDISVINKESNPVWDL